MIFSHGLVILSSLISVIGAVFYIRDTLSGKTKPNRISWGLWALAPMVATGAALHANADVWATTRIFLAGFLPLIVFLASFINKKSYWKISHFDIICGLFSLIAIAVWTMLDSPRLAILIAAIGDGFACIPTVIKSWKFPETETGITYILGFITVLMVLPSIPVWNIENSAFQIYLLIADGLIALGIYHKKLLSFLK